MHTNGAAENPKQETGRRQESPSRTAQWAFPFRGLLYRLEMSVIRIQKKTAVLYTGTMSLSPPTLLELDSPATSARTAGFFHCGAADGAELMRGCFDLFIRRGATVRQRIVIGHGTL